MTRRCIYYDRKRHRQTLSKITQSKDQIEVGGIKTKHEKFFWKQIKSVKQNIDQEVTEFFQNDPDAMENCLELA